jgi:hypothetical protein
MRKVRNNSKRAKWSEFTAVKMERGLYQKAKSRARSRHQTYSEYVRQLIVSDTANPPEEVANA